jgi:glycosyltransferase involved in cell wall biosynthesis
LTEELNLEEHVTFLRFQPQNEVLAWMQKAKLLVLPSLEEAQGVVLLEALACGTPLVASRVDGIPEVVTPDVGILVPPADSQALSEAIQGILGDRQGWRVMSQQARRRAVSCYSWDRTASQFMSLYHRIVD